MNHEPAVLRTALAAQLKMPVPDGMEDKAGGMAAARLPGGAWGERIGPGLELCLHLPLMEFSDEGQSPGRVRAAVDAARESGFAAVSANDHFLFQTPWLDGPTALAAVIDRSGAMELATTIANVVLRGPVPLAKTLAALDVLSEGRVIAGVGPGSSERDYEAVGVRFEERWERFDEAVAILRSLLQDEPPPQTRRHYALPDSPLAPGPSRPGGVPIWIGSWGSPAGLRRVARLGDGWLASAYNTTPDAFRAAKQSLSEQLDARGKDPDRFPNALATMWTWISEDARDADRVLREVAAPMLKRDPEPLSDQLCIGPAAHCAELLSRYAEAGCERVYLWPLGDESRQIELAATTVLPAVTP